MRRQVLGAAAASAAATPKKRSDSNFYKLTIGAFLGIYLLLQLFLWLGHDSSGGGAGGKGGVVRNAVRYQQKGGQEQRGAVGGGRGAIDEGVVASSVDAVPVAFTGRIPESAPKGVFFGASNEVGATLVEATSSDFRVEVTDGGEDFEWSSLDTEPPYPAMAGNEDAVPILAARPQLESVGQAWEAAAAAAKAAAAAAAKAAGKDAAVAEAAVKLPPRGANELFDAMGVTIGHPCWTSPRLLYAMGLDSMAAYLSDQAPPKDLQRSKAPHAYAPLVSDLWCSFHSTPVQGGLQCCCNSNNSLPAFRGGLEAPPPTLPKEGGSFFCLPSLTFAGARGTGIGRLYALFHQHAYMVTSPASPPHVHSAVDNRLLVDTVMPRYAAHFLSQTPPEWQALATFEERNKAVSSKYWIDASPSYFYGINVSACSAAARRQHWFRSLSLCSLSHTHAHTHPLPRTHTPRPQSPLLLRKLLPRGKVILLLRDTVDRGYTDLVRYLAAKKGMPTEEAFLAAVHGCVRAAVCARKGSGQGASSSPIASWDKKGSARFQQCVSEAAAGLPELAGLAAEVEGEKGAAPLACLAAAVGPGGSADWSSLFSAYSLTTGKATPPVSCTTMEEGSGGSAAGAAGLSAGTPGTPLFSEARGVIRWGLRQLVRRQIIGCLPPAAFGRTPLEDIAAVSQEAVLEGIRRGAGLLSACSTPVEPATAIPVPTDLLAGVVAGYELNLVEVSADFPASAPAAGRVLTDGTDSCFPGGLEGYGANSEAHALGRSLYLRPLQRIHAAYGKDVPMMYDSGALKTRPLGIMDPILESMLVYKPVLEPGKTKAAIAKLGWKGEEGDVDGEPAGTFPEMSEEVSEALKALYAPYDAALRVYMGEEWRHIVKGWKTSKAAAGGGGGGGEAEEPEAEEPVEKKASKRAKGKGKPKRQAKAE